MLDYLGGASADSEFPVAQACSPRQCLPLEVLRSLPIYFFDQAFLRALAMVKGLGLVLGFIGLKDF